VEDDMPFKFENLEVWQLGLEYVDLMYELADRLPKSEEYNLKSQLTRAATSVTLNIAEGSTGQSNAEQGRFLGMAIRSLIETVACQRLIARRGYIKPNAPLLIDADLKSQMLARKLHSFRKSLTDSPQISEEQTEYLVDDEH
jgi:four helix bundle protein